MQYHVDGELVDANEAIVHVEDRGFQYGDAAFETVRAYGGVPFEWARHRKRLDATLDTLGMADAAPDDLRERVETTLSANNLEDAYVRASVTRGVQPGKLTPHEQVDPTIVVIVKRLPRGGLDGQPTWDDPATVQTVETRRVASEAVPPAAKTHNYLNGILARLELRHATNEGTRSDEALMRDVDGYVAEGASSNLMFVDDGTLMTPATGELLPGITREVVLELARDEKFPVETGRFDVDDVREADEAFLTNSTWELRPIGTVDGLEVGGGPVTELLRRLYAERVERCCYRA